jgi:hypothetical protein
LTSDGELLLLLLFVSALDDEVRVDRDVHVAEDVLDAADVAADDKAAGIADDSDGRLL